MIQIPENLKKVCKDNTIKALAMFDNTEVPSKISFDEYQNFYQAKVFLQKFKTDGWIMCRQIWEAVWEDLVNDLDIENHNIIYITDLDNCFDLANDISDYSLFTASYEINKHFEINFSVVMYWQNKQLGVFSSINNQDNDDFAIIQETSKLIAVKNCDCDTYNDSQHTVSINDSDTISDEDIKQFRQFAQEIISYFNKHKKEVLNHLK